MASEVPQRSVSFFCPDELPGVRVQWIVESTAMMRFYSETYDLVLVRQGESVVRSGGRQHAASPGTVMLLEPHTVFSHVRLPVPETVLVLHVAPEVVDDARRHHAPNARRRHAEEISRGSGLREALVRLHGLFEVDGTTLERQSLFASILRGFFEDRSVEALPVEQHAVKRARDLIHEKFRDVTTLDELARETNMSPFYLNRCFRRAFGVAPHTYQTLLRVANARGLLARGVPPCEAAAESGFCDQSHLTRHFRRAHGVTPADYARAVRSRMPSPEHLRE